MAGQESVCVVCSDKFSLEAPLRLKIHISASFFFTHRDNLFWDLFLSTVVVSEYFNPASSNGLNS